MLLGLGLGLPMMGGRTVAGAPPPDYPALMNTLLSGTTGWLIDPADTAITLKTGPVPVTTPGVDTVAEVDTKFGTTLLSWTQGTGAAQPLWNGASLEYNAAASQLLAGVSHAFSSGVLGTTFTVRFRVDDITANRCIFGYGTGATTAIRFRLQTNSSGGLDLSLRRLDADGGTTIASNAGIISTGVDYTAQVTINYLTGAVAFYLNGVAQGTGTYPGTDGSTGVSATNSARSRWGVNNSNTLNDFFDGKIGAAVWAPSVLGSTDLANCRGFVERNAL